MVLMDARLPLWMGDGGTKVFRDESFLSMLGAEEFAADAGRVMQPGTAVVEKFSIPDPIEGRESRNVSYIKVFATSAAIVP
jgi:hypothetical protein